jgi:hypothetical protein
MPKISFSSLWFAFGTLMGACFVQSTALAQNLEYPPGYKEVTYESGWIKGSDQTTQCAGLVARHHPGKQYRIVKSWEDQKFENPTLRLESRYNYHCTLLIKE